MLKSLTICDSLSILKKMGSLLGGFVKAKNEVKGSRPDCLEG